MSTSVSASGSNLSLSQPISYDLGPLNKRTKFNPHSEQSTSSGSNSQVQASSSDDSQSTEIIEIESDDEKSFDPSSSSSTPLSALPIPNSQALALSSSSAHSSSQPIEMGSDAESLASFVTVIVCSIQEMILESPTDRNEDLASKLIEANPDLSFSIKQYRLSSLTAALQSYLKDNGIGTPRKFKEILTKIYLNSLLNGPLKDALIELEETIEEMINLVSPDSIGKILQNGSVLLQIEKPSSEDRDYMYKTLHKLTLLRNYTQFIDPEQNEAISLMIDRSFDEDDKPAYPNCRKHFSSFCTRLTKVLDKELNPTDLIHKLHDKSKAWQAKLKRPAETDLAVTDREMIQNRHLDSFWIAGALLVRNALEREIYQRTKKGTRIPQLLITAMEKAMHDHKIEGKFHVLLNQMRKHGYLKVKDGFFNSVWSHYFTRLDEFEYPDLVTRVLNRTSLESHQALLKELDAINQKIKEAADKAPLTPKERKTWNEQKARKVEKVCQKILPKECTLTMLKEICQPVELSKNGKEW